MMPTRSAAPQMLLLGLMLLVVNGCQDTTSNSAIWTVSDIHVGIGLVGGHQQLACLDCHQNAALQSLPAACEECHLDLYDTVSEPDHRASGYAKMCAQCHDSHAWVPSSFDHDAFAFRLEGAHVRVVCGSCHPSGDTIAKVSTDCWSCHESNYTGAEPNHVALGFSRQCQDCHTTVDWRADFDHEGTRFPLRGSHLAATCLACHTDGYVETPTDCAVCHAVQEPLNHFGPDCAACHTDVAWKPSTFNHEPDFPLQSGDHRKYRNDCAACHLDSSDFGSFTCTACHDGEHERRDMDDEHDDVRDYRYDSVNCYDCHPRGGEDDAEGDDDDD